MKKIFNPQYSFKAFLYLIPLSFSICIIGNVYVSLLPISMENEVSNQVYKMLEDGKLRNAILLIGLMSPIIEELFFRLFLYAIVKRFLGDKFAIILTTIAFAIAHMNLPQGLYALFAGFCLGVIRYLYNSIFCTIFMHVIMNIVVVIFVDSFSRMTTLRDILFILMIAVVIFILSAYRIYMIFKEKKERK